MRGKIFSDRLQEKFPQKSLRTWRYFLLDKSLHEIDLGALGARLEVRFIHRKIISFINPKIIDPRSFRLIDLEEIKATGKSWDLSNFQKTLFNQIRVRREILKTSWFGSIQNFFLVVIPLYTAN